ncbi:MAG: methyltransferase domain-containing protein [Nitrospirae bacterium]|nr:methyltransferase domain-containing protein [Nitrospirota bacterium]
MKSIATWKPSKYVPAKRGWTASRNIAEVARSDRFIADIQCRVYERLIRKHARGRLLDLGCGKVPLYGIYRDHVSDCICVDWPDTPHPSPHVDIEADLNGPLPFEDGIFNTILITDVLEHIAQPDMLWREMARTLAPGGSIILTTPFLHCIHEAPHDYARYTEFSLRRFCEENGIEIVELEAYGGSPEVLLDLIAKHLGFSRILSAIHLAIAKTTIGLRPFRKISAKTAAAFPLGYALVATKGLRLFSAITCS